MTPRPWAHTDLAVSPVALGAMRMIGRGGDPAAHDSVREAEDLVGAAIDCGINLIDHADIYVGGNCEKLFGEVLRRNPGWRDRLVLQSKCGIRFNSHRYDQSPGHIESSVDGILSRLGIEHLDVLLLHRPDPLFEPELVAGAFDRLHAAGKVRHFGVSNFSASQMQFLASALRRPIVANQIELSLFHPWALTEGVFVNRTESVFTGAEGLVDHCRAENVQVQAWSPVAGGGLAVSDPGKDDERKVAVRTAAESVGDRLGLRSVGVGIAWLLKHPAGIVPVVGTTKSERIREAARAVEVTMDDETWWELFRAALGRKLP